MKQRATNRKSVVFIKDYTNKKKGDIMPCDSVMAANLIQLGVARLSEESVEEEIEIQIEQEEKKKTKKKK